MFGICPKRRIGTPHRGFVLQLQIPANASEKFRWAVSSKQAVMAFYHCHAFGQAVPGYAEQGGRRDGTPAPQHSDALQILQTAFAGRDASAHRQLQHLQTAEIRPVQLAVS